MRFSLTAVCLFNMVIAVDDTCKPNGQICSPGECCGTCHRKSIGMTCIDTYDEAASISKTYHYTAAYDNVDYTLNINQVSGQTNFTILPQDTTSSPDDVCSTCMAVFSVGGIWNVANVDLATVNLQCKLHGGIIYNKDYDCNGAGSDYGNCPVPTG